MKINITAIAGTRPEAIKMAPVINALKQEEWADVKFLATAQHREMLDQVLELFGLEPDVDLDIMKQNQTLPELTARLLTALDSALEALSPDVVLAQGDTTTVMCAALASFYRQIPFGHVEAGLRTGDIYNPFPEEANRAVAGRLTTFHFAPTDASAGNLLKEGIPSESIYVTGNTVIDALLEVADRDIKTGIPLDDRKRLILVTAHRRENFGPPFESICRAMKRIVSGHPDVEILYPVHPNPNVRDVAMRELDGVPGIRLCAPLDYGPFVSVMKRAHVILTDSGGVQEEAPALGKPVLVMRTDTERPEAVAEGVVKLVGTDESVIVSEMDRLLDDRAAWSEMARGASPYGDGRAAGRIVNILKEHFAL
jgi:UDP-N-acetylglucosamine 2-epimerase (non-hydrolysing)